MKHIYTIALSALLLSSLNAAAQYDMVETNQSTISFGYRQMGVPMEGKFGQFSANVAFDPANLAGARARIDVNLASIDTGSSDANEEVVGKQWFNAKSYPLASFVSTGIRPLGNNRYQASGKLTIKGKTLDIAAPVTFVQQGARALFDGSFNIKRLAYDIGTGEWTDVGTDADDVQIRFHLVVSATPAAPISTQPKRKQP